MPDNPVKHIPKPQSPVGSQRKGKLKVKDGTTGKVSWRSGKKGFKRDWDGDPTSKDYNARDFKPSHKIHAGSKGKVGKSPTDNQMPEMPEDG